ncbi:MAG: M23 family metallopeptidase [Porticoccaceae bacterium]|nr:M23 family metallopeptidase [Porticoccaceae bacterium]
MARVRLSVVSLMLVCLAATLKLQASPMVLQGSLQQGSLLLGTVEKGSRAVYRDRALPVTASGQFLLGLGRDAPASIELRIVDSEGLQTVQKYEVAKRDYRIQRVNGVPSKTVDPSASDLARIRNDSALVASARREITSKEDFLDGFQLPLDGPITGVYGSQRVYNGVPKSPHYGVDYAAPTGTQVLSPAAGIVRLAHRDLFYSGGTLIVDHGHGLSSSFLHLSDVLVAEGTRVSRGQPIAKVGATGRATGPHLDWRMNWHNERIDPQLVLETLPAQ